MIPGYSGFTPYKHQPLVSLKENNNPNKNRFTESKIKSCKLLYFSKQ